MKILLNDQHREIVPSSTLGDLLTALGLVGRKGVAVAVNDSVVPRTTWPEHRLDEGDRVLVIQATQGG